MIFTDIKKTSLPMFRDRWSPLYLEHGRLEIDDSSVKFLNADGYVIPIPVASCSSLNIGPGVSVTHAAIKALSESNVTINWVSNNQLTYLMYGVTSTSNCEKSILHAKVFADKKLRMKSARMMFKKRFPDIDVDSYSIKELMGFEGNRIRKSYKDFGIKYGIEWKGRRFTPQNWELTDDMNNCISILNSALYSYVLNAVVSMGYIPHLGMIHSKGKIPFVYDIADIYKVETSIPAAFKVLSEYKTKDTDKLYSQLKLNMSESNVNYRIIDDIKEVIDNVGDNSK